MVQKARILLGLARGPVSSGAGGREFESRRSDQHLAQIKALAATDTATETQVIGRVRALGRLCHLDDKQWLSALQQAKLALTAFVKKDSAATRAALAKARLRLFELAS